MQLSPLNNQHDAVVLRQMNRKDLLPARTVDAEPLDRSKGRFETLHDETVSRYTHTNCNGTRVLMFAISKDCVGASV